MKKTLLIVAAVLALAVPAFADKVGIFAQTSATGALVKASAATAAIATPGTAVGPYVLVTKMLVQGVPGGVTLTVWDTPAGLTGSASARKLLDIYQDTATTQTYDFTSENGEIPALNGLEVKGYLTIVQPSAITVTATVMYRQWGNLYRTRP